MQDSQATMRFTFRAAASADEQPEQISTVVDFIDRFTARIMTKLQSLETEGHGASA